MATTATDHQARPIVRQPDRELAFAALAFLVAAVLHNADHFRRGTDSVTTELLVTGYLGMALSAVAIGLVLAGHRLAPLVAVSIGFPLALGFTAAHWLPTWSALSDSFVEGGAEPVSIVASLLEVAGALALAVAGLRALRRQGGLAGIGRA
jgi:hypothetical protein